MEALPRPVLGHLDPEFLACSTRSRDRLRAVFRTDERADAADQRHRLGGHGSVLRQPGRAGRHRDRRRQRRVRRAHVRRRAPRAVPRSCASTSRGAARSIRSGCSTRTRAHPHARAARGRARGDVDRCRERRRAARRAARHRHVAARRHGHVARRHPGRGRRLGHRRGLLGHAEVPRCSARARAAVVLGARGRAGPRPRATPSQSWYLDLGLHRRLRRRGAPLPPHRADLDDLRAARRARCAARRRARRVVGAARARRRALLQDALPELGFRARSPQERPAARSSRPCGCPTASTTPSCAASCATASTSRSAAGSASSPGKGWRIGLMGHGARERSVVTCSVRRRPTRLARAASRGCVVGAAGRGG